MRIFTTTLVLPLFFISACNKTAEQPPASAQPQPDIKSIEQPAAKPAQNPPAKPTSDQTAKKSDTAAKGELTQEEKNEIHKNGYLLSSHDTLGGVRDGYSAAKVLAALGEPQSRGELKDQRNEIIGRFTQTWNYPDKGAVVTMASPSKKGKQMVLHVEIKAPSNLTTQKGIGIGATMEQVVSAYKNENAEEAPPRDQLYGQLDFQFKAGKVVSITQTEDPDGSGEGGD